MNETLDLMTTIDDNEEQRAANVRRIVTGVSYAVFNIFGFIGNGAVLVTLLKEWKKFGAFYVLVFALASFDFIYVAVNLLVQTPETLFGVFYPRMLRMVISSVNTFGFIGFFTSSLIIGFNRFSVFLIPPLYEKIFVKPAIYAVGAVPLIAATLAAIGVTLVDCPKLFNEKGFHWYYACDKNVTHPYGGYWMTAQGYIVQTLPVIMMIGYVIVYAYLKWDSKNNVTTQTTAAAQRKRAERSLLLQGLIIGAFLWGQTSSFWVLQNGFVTNYWIKLAIQCLHITNSSINPVIYIVFNKLLRNEMCRTITCGRYVPGDDNSGQATGGGMQHTAPNS